MADKKTKLCAFHECSYAGTIVQNIRRCPRHRVLDEILVEDTRPLGYGLQRPYFRIRFFLDAERSPASSKRTMRRLLAGLRKEIKRLGVSGVEQSTIDAFNERYPLHERALQEALDGASEGDHRTAVHRAVSLHERYAAFDRACDGTVTTIRDARNVLRVHSGFAPLPPDTVFAP
jgi:hypothetical protein